MLACTRTAISALAWLVSATSPSIPAVRPVLRCVTCRTLTSVLLQLRSASFCKFLASGQSPASHRLEDPPAQPPYLLLMATPVHTIPGATTERGQALRSVHRSVQRARQFRLLSLRLKGSPAHVSAPCGPERRARYPASYTGTSREETRPCGTRLPAAFRPPAFASWAPCPARGLRLLRSAYRPACTYRACRAEPWEVPTFRTHETRTGPGALLSRGRRCRWP